MPFLIDILKTTPRLKLLKTVTIIQNIGVGISAGIFIWQIKLAENRAENNQEFDFNSFLIWGSVLILIQTFVNMASKMSGKVVIERDWIVVVAKKNSEENPKLSYKEHLTQLNSSLTFIDMFVTVLAGIPPLVIWDFAGVYFIVYFVAGYNVVCCFVEIFLMYYLASLTPELKKKVANDDEIEVDSSSIDSSSTVSGRVDSDSTSEKNPEKDTSYLKNFRIFFNNEFWVMGVSLSMLYFSVIGPSGVTRVYMLDNCITISLISIPVVGSSIFGILGMITYNRLMKHYKSTTVVKIISFFHWPFIVIAGIGILPFIPDTLFKPFESYNYPEFDGQTREEFCLDKNYTISIIIFTIGAVICRAGLWGFDLSITQVFQENIVENERAVFGAIQASLNDFFDCLMYGLIIVLDKNFQFGWCVIGSVVFTCLAHLLVQFHYSGGKVRQLNQVEEVEGSGNKALEMEDFENIDR